MKKRESIFMILKNRTWKVSIISEHRNKAENIIP